jgi:actin-related protein
MESVIIDHLVNPFYLVNFEYLEEIMNKSLIDNLMINPKETPLIFTESAIHNKENRLKLTEFMFEKY